MIGYRPNSSELKLRICNLLHIGAMDHRLWTMDSRLSAQQHHLLLLIPRFPKHPYFLRDDGVDRFANIIGLNRKLPAETPINKNAEFNFGGSSEIEQCIQCSANGAACI